MRTKRYASAIVRPYVELPRSRKEVEVLGHQLLRSGTSVAAHIREASRARVRNSAPKLTGPCRRRTSPSYGSNC